MRVPRHVDRGFDHLFSTGRARAPAWSRPTTRPSPLCQGKPRSPRGAEWDSAVAYWRTIASEHAACHDKVVTSTRRTGEQWVTWGTSPDGVVAITGIVPDPAALDDPARRAAAEKSLAYMGAELRYGGYKTSQPSHPIFMGGFTNSHIEDLRAAAEVARGARPCRSRREAGAGRPGLGTGQAPGGGGRARPHLHRGRLRMA